MKHRADSDMLGSHPPLASWRFSAGEHQRRQDGVTSLSPSGEKEHHFLQLTAGEKGNQFIWEPTAKIPIIAPWTVKRCPATILTVTLCLIKVRFSLPTEEVLLFLFSTRNGLFVKCSLFAKNVSCEQHK